MDPTVPKMKDFLRLKQQLMATDPQKFKGEKILLGSNRKETIASIKQWMKIEQGDCAPQ